MRRGAYYAYASLHDPDTSSASVSPATLTPLTLAYVTKPSASSQSAFVQEPATVPSFPNYYRGGGAEEELNDAGMVASVDCYSDDEQKASNPRPNSVMHLKGCIVGEGNIEYTAASTNGDGACGLHATWGEVVGSWYEWENARERLGGLLLDIDATELDNTASRFKEAFHDLLGVAKTDLVAQARNNFCGEDLDVDPEVRILWDALPRHCHRRRWAAAAAAYISGAACTGGAAQPAKKLDFSSTDYL